LSRQTRETRVNVKLDLDGTGRADIHTGVGFFDHMLDLLSRHSLIDLTVRAEGDLDVDAHHTVEDVGIVIGQALDQALGDKLGISRYGWAIVPMDESLAQVAIDLSGRPAFVFKVKFPRGTIGDFPVELVEEFFKSVATNAKMNLHAAAPYGSNNHHIAEALFKAAARALRQAVSHDPRNPAAVPSTKGQL
jgi:imidazoleglycerol-phosphate dehydratase